MESTKTQAYFGNFLYVFDSLFRNKSASKLLPHNSESHINSFESLPIKNRIPVSHSSFLAPNEEEPENSVEIFKKAPTGAYVGVGTERCLFAPVFNHKITDVIMADHDTRVNYYNEINISLIKASPDRETYKQLCFAESFESFKNTLEKNSYNPINEKINLFDDKHFKWLQHVLISSKFRKYHSGVGGFSQVSYLHNDSSYARVKSLADQDKLSVMNFDLNNSSDLKTLSEKISEKNIKISVYDISNSWWSNYISKDNSPKRSFMIGPDCFEKDGIVLVTDRYYAKPWFYIGFRREDLLKHLNNDDNILNYFFCKFNTDKVTLLEKIEGIKPNSIVTLPSIVKESIEYHKETAKKISNSTITELTKEKMLNKNKVNLEPTL